jgi:hypothetical protein
MAVQHLFSQEIKGAEGRWAIVNITPEQARDKAIEEAKKEALRKAGIMESIKAADVLSTFEANERSNQLFSSFSSIEVQGAVIRYDIVEDEIAVNSVDGRLYAVVVIDAAVKKYASVADPEFKIDVRGLRSNGYRNGETISFSVFPNKEGYLKVFLFENTETASLVFPNKYEPNRQLRAKERVEFPTRAGINYKAEKITTDKLEHNLLLFVYTKSDIPFYDTVSYPHVLNWINNIEPEEREVIIEPILISE